MDLESLLKEFVQKENVSGCYDCRVAGENVYNIIRTDVRRLYTKSNGQEVMPLYSPLNKRSAVISFFISFWHLVKLGVKCKQVDNIIFSFGRIEKIGDYYVDKFTDPVIEFSRLKQDCLIFERSRAGVHRTPRIHREIVVFTDVFDILSRIYSILYSPFFWRKHKQELNALFEIVNKMTPFSDRDRESAVRKITEYRALSCFYGYVYRRLSPKRVLMVHRLLSQLCRAKKMEITTVEFQHGITYGETHVYSGRRDLMFIPDYFFAFGNTPPRDVYGIGEKQIINIGWAFPLLISELNVLSEFSEKDILVISDPEITDKIVDVVGELAKANPSYRFHIRPHPMEVIGEKHRIVINGMKNVVIQDNKINSNLVLNSFTHIIGENSTVLYEALSAGKKVGKLCYPLFEPIYLDPADREAVWEIASQEDFEKYVSESVTTRRSLSIYSKFDSEKIFDALTK